MVAKPFVLLLCVSSHFAGLLSQCIGREAIFGPPCGGWPYERFGPIDEFESYSGLMPFDRYGLGIPGAGVSPFMPAMNGGFGGGLIVTSASPIAPTGLIVTSENAIEGIVAVAGQLPFLGAVVTDGAFATAGAGTVSYDCGDGSLGIVAEAPVVPAPIVPAFGYGLGQDLFGYRGINGEWSCGNLY